MIRLSENPGVVCMGLNLSVQPHSFLSWVFLMSVSKKQKILSFWLILDNGERVEYKITEETTVDEFLRTLRKNIHIERKS